MVSEMSDKKYACAAMFCAIVPFIVCFSQAGWAQFEFRQQDQSSMFNMFGEEKAVSVTPDPRFNRVEGLFLGVNITTRPFKDRLRVLTNGGYGISSKTWRYEIGLQQEFFQSNTLCLGVSYFDETATNDGWVINSFENSLAALFLKEDFFDYFGRTGWRGIVDQKFYSRHSVRIDFSSYEYEDMTKTDNFASSILGRNKTFRANPSVSEGSEQSLKLMLELDWLDTPLLPMQGWLIQSIYEKTFGDFETDGLFLKIFRFQPTFHNQRILSRLFIGLRKGSLAEQHLIDIGGVGTLRGFREKYQSGQNFCMVNVNYLFGGDILQHLPLHFIPLYDQLSMGLFIDAGSAWGGDEEKGSLFDYMGDADLLVDCGASLLVADGLVRFDFARQVKGGESNWRITMRLLSNF